MALVGETEGEGKSEGGKEKGREEGGDFVHQVERGKAEEWG